MGDFGSLAPEDTGAAAAAQRQYPILRSLGIAFKTNPKPGPNKLEFWPPGEPGTSDAPRPQNIPMHHPGVEIYDPSISPLDVLGDVASHHLIHTDPTVSAAYKNFGASLTPEQKNRLREQYSFAKENDGEARPYQDWESSSGLPAYFRGYPFKQWPDDFNARAYTPDQRKGLDEMMNYLRSPRGEEQPFGSLAP